MICLLLSSLTLNALNCTDAESSIHVVTLFLIICTNCQNSAPCCVLDQWSLISSSADSDHIVNIVMTVCKQAGWYLLSQTGCVLCTFLYDVLVGLVASWLICCCIIRLKYFMWIVHIMHVHSLSKKCHFYFYDNFGKSVPNFLIFHC